MSHAWLCWVVGDLIMDAVQLLSILNMGAAYMKTSL